MTLTRLILLAALAGAPFGHAQTAAPPCQQRNCYTASTGNVTLTAAATAATIQQAAAGPFQTVRGIKATVYCSVPCIATRTKDGTPATTTAAQAKIVASPLQPNGYAAPTFLFFTASNAAGGTAIDVTNIPAGVTQIFDLTDVGFGAQPSQTYTISIAAITGQAAITFYVTAQ